MIEFNQKDWDIFINFAIGVGGLFLIYSWVMYQSRVSSHKK